jgi:hypothetical protein
MSATMRRRRTTTSPRGACTFFKFSLFWCLDDKGGEDSYLYLFSFQCVMGLNSMGGGRDGQEPFDHGL